MKPKSQDLCLRHMLVVFVAQNNFMFWGFQAWDFQVWKQQALRASEGLAASSGEAAAAALPSAVALSATSCCSVMGAVSSGTPCTAFLSLSDLRFARSSITNPCFQWHADSDRNHFRHINSVTEWFSNEVLLHDSHGRAKDARSLKLDSLCFVRRRDCQITLTGTVDYQMLAQPLRKIMQFHPCTFPTPTTDQNDDYS